MLSVLLYAGEGADSEARADLRSLLAEYFSARQRPDVEIVETVDGAEFQDSAKLQRFSLLAFPGGFDMGFVRCLGQLGMANLTERVRSGRCGYLGMCAGAYFACREIEFAKGDPELEVLGRRLGLYSGRAVGPVFPGFDYKSLAGARVVENAFINSQTNAAENKVLVYFNGGPKFVDELDSAARQMAVYTEDEAAGQSAVVLSKFGSGAALLFGAHPEMDKTSLASSPDPRLKEIYDQLSRNVEQRRQATYAMLDELMKIVEAGPAAN